MATTIDSEGADPQVAILTGIVLAVVGTLVVQVRCQAVPDNEH